MNASTEVDEPRSSGNAENDPVTFPDLRSENVASELETLHKKSPPTCAERLKMTRTRTPHMRRTISPQVQDAIGETKSTYSEKGNVDLDSN